MIRIGEKLNGSISAAARAIANRDEVWIRKTAREQAESEAVYLDICSANAAYEEETLRWMIETVERETKLPLCIDSPDTEMLLKCRYFCRQPGILNSVSMEKKRRIDEVFHMMQENREWQAAVMLCGEDGIPDSVEGKLEIFEEILEKAESYGIDASRLYVDPAVGAAVFQEPKEGKGPVSRLLETMDRIRERCPAVHRMAALSNISYGLPARKSVNCSFAVLGLAHGMDSAIFDVTDRDLGKITDAAERLLKNKEELKIEQVSQDSNRDRYTRTAATVLAIEKGLLFPDEILENTEDPFERSVVYAAAALLGLDRQEYCMGYIEAYRKGFLQIG